MIWRWLPLLLLAACTNDPAGGGLSLASLRGNGEAPAEAAMQQVTITPEVIAALPLPTVMLVRRQATGEFTFMSPIGGNNGSVVLMSQARDSVTLRGGVVVASNGFGHDLYGLERGAGTRTYLFLDAESRLVREAFRCEVKGPVAQTLALHGRRIDTQAVIERCTSPERRIENRYWIGARDGVAWRSVQWLGPDFGYIEIETLKQASQG